MNDQKALILGINLSLVARQTGISEKVMVRLIEKHDFSQSDLPDVLEIMKEFCAKESSIARFVNQEGVSIQDVHTLYQTRSMIQGFGKSSSDCVSLIAILRTHQIFSDCPLDSEILADKILSAHQIIQGPFVGVSLDRAAKTAKDLGMDSLAEVVEYFDSKGLNIWRYDDQPICDYLMDDITFRNI